jgi:hypothetical protein
MKLTIKLLAFFILVPVFMAAAQTTEKKDSYPYWTISKDVQRMQYKNTLHTPVKIALGDVRASVTKSIHRNNEPVRQGTVIRTGYPTWTISKGVARQQAERNSR